jgi:hypothetical protein
MNGRVRLDLVSRWEPGPRQVVCVSRHAPDRELPTIPTLLPGGELPGWPARMRDRLKMRPVRSQVPHGPEPRASATNPSRGGGVRTGGHARVAGRATRPDLVGMVG